MQALSFREEQVLRALWHYAEGARAQQVRQALPQPWPPYTTLASLLQQLVQKNYARVEKRGRDNWFTARLAAADYARDWLTRFVTLHFAGSYAALVGSCLRHGQLTEAELAKIIINQRVLPA